ncbi:MAG: diaminopimelate epimerase [Solirubrobacterales bacterium]
MDFEKWQALGNDYLIVEAAELPVGISPERIRLICDPHLGIGGDGLVLVEPSEDTDVVASLRIFNPDGSEAELSGNGVRQAVLYLRRKGWASTDTFTVDTKAGAITPTILGDGRCSVAMGVASTTSVDYPDGGDDGLGVVQAGGREWPFRHVSIGNPQCAIEVDDDLAALDLQSIGPEIENSELFPNRTNVSFYRRSGSQVRARIFERGVGETLSSGTGAIGAAIAAHLDGSPRSLEVELDGGRLDVDVSGELEVTLTGPAEPVFNGQASPEFLRRLAEVPD